jgi:hypothetical protein
MLFVWMDPLLALEQRIARQIQASLAGRGIAVAALQFLGR